MCFHDVESTNSLYVLKALNLVVERYYAQCIHTESQAFIVKILGCLNSRVSTVVMTSSAQLFGGQFKINHYFWFLVISLSQQKLLFIIRCPDSKKKYFFISKVQQNAKKRLKNYVFPYQKSKYCRWSQVDGPYTKMSFDLWLIT